MSKKMEISTFYRVSVANVAAECEGDFIDAMSNDTNANSYFFGVCEDDAKVIACHVETGSVLIDAKSIDEAIEMFLRFPFQGGYQEPILKPILLAAIHNDTEQLAAAFDKETFRFYSASEMDDVAEYKSRIAELPSICGFGAVSYNTGATYDFESQKFEFDGEDFENLSDLNGYFDEESWVVVLRPYNAPSQDDKTAPPTVTTEASSGSSKRFCTECGEKLAENTKFCGNCGKKVV